MSLPQFEVQGSLFESLGAIAPELFAEGDKYKLFAQKVWPVLAQCREALRECYQTDNGRPGVEPVVLLGGVHLPVLGANAGSPSRRASEVSSGLEADRDGVFACYRSPGLAHSPDRRARPGDRLRQR